MRKLHNIITFILGIGFWFALQSVSGEGVSPVRALLTLSAYVVVLGMYNRWYLAFIGKHKIWTSLRPFLLIVTGALVLFFIPSAFLRSLFLVILSILLIMTELFLDNYAENFLLNETLVLVFFSSFSFMALQEVFPERVLWGVGGVFFSTFLITRVFYEFLPQSPKLKTLAAIVLAFFTCQLYWAMSFLPYHYSALGFLLFNAYYFCMILTYYSFFLTLNRKKIYFHLTLMTLTSGIVLIATPWRVIQ